MLVTLLTDFGLDDTYVGQLKAAVRAVAPRAVLVDLTHTVPPQDIRSGAFHLWTAMAAFPRPAVHLAVVDPGVGTARRAIAARSRKGHLFVGPDNGLLAPAIERTGGLAAAVTLEGANAVRHSRTFHGRDVFAPAAGHLLRGLPLGRLGRRVSKLVASLVLPAPGAVGEVLHADRFGNLITSLAPPAARRFVLQLGRRRIPGRRDWTYGHLGRGEVLALVGSSGLLEIAVRDGSAAKVLHATVGARVRLR